MGHNDRQGLEGIHVLVIDFAAEVRHQIRAVLEPLGALVTTTTAAGVADTTIIADVILCDLTLIQATGPVFLATLRAKHGHRGVPAPAIAFVTGGPPTEARVRAAGFQRHITTPVNPDELRRAILQLVDR